jgi:hypothetical protein
MDLNKIKSRLDNLNQAAKPKNTEKKDYTLIYWKPKAEGKYQIRFVPSKINKDNPFQEVFMHYGVGKFPIVALTNWGEDDPIVEFSKKLRKSSESENWRLAKQLDPKMRVFVVNASKVQDRPGFALSLRPKPKQTPLSSDASQITTWLENQPILLEERYKYTYDKLKEELQTFISGGEEKEDDIISEPASGFEDDSPAKEEKKFTLSTQGTPKKAKSEEFDSLFEDDGLPF